MVCNTQNNWVPGLRPLFGSLKATNHSVSETFLRSGERNSYCLDSLRKRQREGQSLDP
jgi:hypothetical protein